MPGKVIATYKAYQESLVVRNGIAGALGRPYEKKASVPQGCPMSMMLVALYKRPWLSLMEEHNVEGRVLADDILILASGRKMLHRFGAALHKTHEYLHDAGAKVAPDKSFNFASTHKATEWLRETTWKIIGGRIPVVKDFRYLGAHLNTAGMRKAGTLDRRYDKAIAML